MQCTLHIPHLIPPVAPHHAAAAWQALSLPALKALLARARYTRSAHADDIAVACESFGLARDHACPVAPLLAHSDGLPADEGYWLCATPVHLETRHHALVLADPVQLQLTRPEASALAATMAEHLRHDHLSLHVAPAGAWYVRCETPPAITTSALGEVIGEDIERFLPKGADALKWHRLLTEIQMLLHTHPVNDAREAAGLAPVNSLWLWGGGTMRALPARGAAPFQSAWSDEPMVRALAQHTGCHIEAHAPHFDATTFSTWQRWHEGHHYFSFHALTPLMRRGDLAAWGAAVIALDRDWFQPLGAALKSRTLARVTLISNNHEATHRFVMNRWDSFKIFNKIKYLR